MNLNMEQFLLSCEEYHILYKKKNGKYDVTPQFVKFCQDNHECITKMVIEGIKLKLPNDIKTPTSDVIGQCYIMSMISTYNSDFIRYESKDFCIDFSEMLYNVIMELTK